MDIFKKVFTICIILLSFSYSKDISYAADTIVFAGDSIMVGLEQVLQKEFIKSGYKCIPLAKVGTGFCRSDKFNWPSILANVVEKEKPDIVVICIGTNDGQVLWNNGHFYAFNSPQWRNCYKNRLKDVISIVSQNGGHTIFISPPVLRNYQLAKNVSIVTDLIYDICQNTGTLFLDIRHVLADNNGHFQYTGLDIHGKMVTLRTKDGVHITNAGNEVLADYIVQSIKQHK